MNVDEILNLETALPPKLLIEASAGCGKTYTIEHLVLKLIREGFSLKELALLTFTKAAAQDLKQRIKNRLELGGEKRALKVIDDASIATFHSFALKVLKESGLRSDFHFEKIHNLSDFKRVFAPLLNKITFPEDLTYTPFNSLEEGRFFRELMKAFSKGEREAPFTKLAAHLQLEREKMEDELIFYDDLIVKLKSKLNDPDFVELFKSQYKVLIVDEFQDTDPVQWEIMEALFDRIYLVGDPKQSIYSFRNADIKSFLRVKEKIGLTLCLDTNYRSHPKIIESLNRLFLKPENVFNVSDQHKIDYHEIKAGKPFTNYHRFDLVDITGIEKNTVLEFLVHRILESSIPLHEWAILVRTHKESILIQKKLSEALIPFQVRQKVDLAKTDAAFHLKTVLDACRHPRDLARLKGAFSSPLIQQDPLFLDDWEQREKIIFEFLLYQKALKNGIASFYSQFLKNHLSSLFQNPPLFYELEAVVEDIIEWEKENKLADYFGSEKEGEEARVIGPAEGVKIITLHSSKGLEFEAVFLWPYGSIKESDISEEIRLFYVGATRAKSDLTLLVDTSGPAFTSCFFDKCAQVTIPQLAEEIGATLKKIPTQLLKKRIKKDFAPVPPPAFECNFLPTPINSFSRLNKKGESRFFASSLTLPSGMQTGTHLHAILEKIPFDLPVDAKSHVKGTFLEPYLDEINTLLINLFSAELIPGFKLTAIKDKPCFKEIPFTYPSGEGYMQGVIDLAFEWNEEIYLVDWKSHSLIDYSEETLLKVVQEEGYALQAQIYYEAFKRYLKTINCSKPVRGVLFVFIRGAGKILWTP